MDNLKTARTGAWLASLILTGTALFLQGCVADANPDATPKSENVTVGLSLSIKNQTTSPLEILSFRFTSNLKDTVDTVVTIPRLSPGSTTALNMAMDFVPLRWWNIQVQSVDDSGNVLGSANSGPIPSNRPNRVDTLEVNLVTQVE